MAQERIDSIIDIPAVKKEFDQVISLLDDLGSAIKNSGNYSGTGGMAQSLTERKNAMKDMQAQTEQMAAAERKLAAQTETVVAVAKEAIGVNKDSVNSVKAFNGTLDENIKLQIVLKSQLADVKEKQKDLSKNFTGTGAAVQKYQEQMTGLVKQEKELQAANLELNNIIRNQVKEMNAAGNSMNELRAQLNQMKAAADNMDIGSEEFIEAQKQIGALNDKIKKLEFSRGDFQRNVGNYAGTFSGAFNVLKGELDSVREKMATLSSSGQEGTGAFAQLEKEEKLLNELTEKLGVTFGSTRQELRALQEAAKTLGLQLGDDSTIFTQFNSEVGNAVNTVGDFNAMIKHAASDTKQLDGMIAIAQGLAGAYGAAAGAAELFGDGNEDLQKKMVKLQAVMTILQGLQSVQNALQKESAAIQTLLSIRTAVTTAVQKAYTWATGQAIVATNGLKAAISGTGIGLLLVSLASLVTLMAQASDKTDAAAKSMEDFDAAIDNAGQSLEDELDNIELNMKKNEERIKQRGGSEKELSDNIKKQLTEQQNAYSKNSFELLAVQERIENERKRMVNSGKADKKELENLDKKQQEARTAWLRANDNMQKKSFELQVQLEKDKTKAAEDSRKSLKGYSEARIIDIEREANVLNETVNNDKKTYTERVAALDQFYEKQKQITKAKSAVELAQPNLTGGEMAKIVAQENKELEQLQRDYNNTRTKLTEAGVEKQLQIHTELIRVEMEMEKKRNESIVSNEEKSVEERLNAQTKIQKAEATIIETEYKQKREKAKGNADELVLVEKEYESAILSLTIDGNNKVTEIIKSAAEKRKQIKIEEANATLAKMNLGDTNQYAEDVIALNKALRDKEISIDEYNARREKIDRDFGTKQLKNEIANTKELLKYVKDGSQEKYDLLKKLKDQEIKLDDETTQKKLANQQKLKEAQRALIDELKNLTASIIEGTFVKEKNAIEDKITAIEKNKAAEIDRIQSSTLSEQEKADKIKIIEAKAAADSEQLERKKKQVDIQKAKFDRDKAIFDIGINTAIAIAKAVAESPLTGGLPFSAIAAAIGAVQIAAVLAKPLPKFEKGTSSAPEGLAITDEKGPELYIEPGGKTYLGSEKGPTIRYLKEGTKVVPHDQVNKYMLNAQLTGGSTDVIVPASDITAKEIRGLKDIMYWQTNQLSTAYKKQKPNNVKVILMNDFNAYIQKAVRD